MQYSETEKEQIKPVKKDPMICVTKYLNFKRCLEGKQISVMDHIDNATDERKLKT